MPNTKSAKKALRGSEKKRGYNVVRKFKIKNAIKELKRSIAIDATNFQAGLSRVYSALDKAVKGKLIKKGNASRRKSRFAAMVAKIANQPVVEKVIKAQKVKKVTKAAKDLAEKTKEAK